MVKVTVLFHRQERMEYKAIIFVSLKSRWNAYKTSFSVSVFLLCRFSSKNVYGAFFSHLNLLALWKYDYNFIAIDSMQLNFNFVIISGDKMKNLIINVSY